MEWKKGGLTVMWYYDGDHWGVCGWLMLVSMVIFWALIIGGIVASVRYFSGSQPRISPVAAPPPNTAETTLAHRFASGEIDEDEYRRRMVVLREHHRDAAGR